MVVANQSDFGELDSYKQLESSPNTSAKVNGSDCFGAFTNCDSRGMLNLNQDLLINKGDIKTLFRVDKGEPFATGLYAQVKRCKSLSNNCYYAAKFCPRKRDQSVDEECIENLHEIALLSQLKHPYIITFIDAFILEDCAVTIMELAPGGDLQTVIDADLVLLEIDASRYIFQLLEALKYLHERHIAHLDIKPQNLLLMGEDFPNCDIKLCDFEISRVIKPGKEIKEILGTPDYVAPEILLYEPLSTSADMWSVGILCYVLLTGFSPFGGDTDQETFRNIVHEPIDFPDELFEDISPSAIDLIVKLAVKNAKLRPTPAEIEEHEWLKSFIPEITSPPSPPSEPEPEVLHALINNSNTSSISHTGPKKRSPRKTSAALSGLSTASAAGRRPSARSILRACKSAYDLNKMGGKTKSREALVEKMKMASGENSVGGNWKLRKNLSKSREQLWESKIQLSKSCEKINNNLPSTRWASVANFPSLDLGAMKSSTSQESVMSVVSNCTSSAAAASASAIQQEQFLDWNPQPMAYYDDVPLPLLPAQPHHSNSMPNTPPIPNFDLSSPVNHIHMGNLIDSSSASAGSAGLGLGPDFDYPSLVVNNGTDAEDGGEHTVGESGGESCTTTTTLLSTNTAAAAAAAAAADAESQKSVAELIMTFGGRVPNGNPNTTNNNNKKLDLKNQFEPILEVDGSEETMISLGDCSNSSSSASCGSSIIPTTFKDKDKEPKSAESGHFSMNSSSSSSSSNTTEPESSTSSSKSTTATTNNATAAKLCEHDNGVITSNNNKRVSRSSQQIRDEMRAARVNGRNNGDPHQQHNGGHHNGHHQTHGGVSPRRGSTSPPKHVYENGGGIGFGSGLRGILKKPATIVSHKIDPYQYHHHHLNGNSLILPHHHHPSSSAASSRRGSIPGNCTRLYDTHTISSLAKVPKKSILKNSANSGGEVKTNRSCSTDINSSQTSTTPSNLNRKSSGGGETTRVNSKSPENIVTSLKESSPGAGGGEIDHHRTTQKSSSPTEATTLLPDTSAAALMALPKALGNKGKVIPKGLSPRQSPSFILLNDVNVKPKARKPLPKSTTTTVKSSSPTTNNNTSTNVIQPRQKIINTYRTPTPLARSKQSSTTTTNPPSTTRAPTKPRTSIREQILRRKMPEKSDRGPTVTVHLPPTRIRINMTDTTTNTTITTNTILSNKIINKITTPPPSPPLSPTTEGMPKSPTSLISTKSSKFKSELSIEPAAVAIKIFPPDPAIIPKSPTYLLTKGGGGGGPNLLSHSQSFEENNNNDSNNNCGSRGSRSPSCISSTDNINPLLNSLTISNLEFGKSPEMQRRKASSKQNDGKNGNKTTCDGLLGEFARVQVVCTGSIGRAMERFETGTIKGKKLRRGSIPNF